MSHVCKLRYCRLSILMCHFIGAAKVGNMAGMSSIHDGIGHGLPASRYTCELSFPPQVLEGNRHSFTFPPHLFVTESTVGSAPHDHVCSTQFGLHHLFSEVLRQVSLCKYHRTRALPWAQTSRQAAKPATRSIRVQEKRSHVRNINGPPVEATRSAQQALCESLRHTGSHNWQASIVMNYAMLAEVSSVCYNGWHYFPLSSTY